MTEEELRQLEELIAEVESSQDYKIVNARKIGALLCGLSRADISHKKTYNNLRRRLLIEGEKKVLYAYDDQDKSEPRKRIKRDSIIEGSITVGIGFNMDGKGARDFWKAAFGDSISFDKVRKGEVALTNEQANKLYDTVITEKQKELINHIKFRDFVKEIPLNQLLMLEDLCYNKMRVALRMSEYIENHHKTGDKQYLLEAIKCIKEDIDEIEAKIKANPKKFEKKNKRSDQQKKS